MSKQFEEVKEALIRVTGENYTLDDLLEEFTVDEEWNNHTTRVLKGWYAFVTPLGIIAYFGTKEEAFRYRLDYINRILNS